MGQHQQGIESCDVVLKNHPNNPDAFYGKSCCYALQGNIEQAIEYLKLADTQKRNHYKKRAKKEPEFNGIREDSRFQELLNE
jgi:tetratricopeptide (TPR) repeat protein